MAIAFPPPPTYAEPWIVNPQGAPSFNPIWLKWFVDLTAAFTSGSGGGGVVHNALGGLQGGGVGEYYHLTAADATALTAGFTGTGSLVRQTSPSLVTPALGTPASGTMTNVSGTALSLTSGSVKFTAGSAPSTPASGLLQLYASSADKTTRSIDDAGTIRAFGQDALTDIVTASAGINNTETIVVGGLNKARIYANQLQVGSMIRIILEGTCTSTNADSNTWRIRFGTAGTTADGVLGSAASGNSAGSGTTIPFQATLTFTVRTVGGSGTIAGWLTLLNQGTTGVASAAVQIIALTPTNIDTTVDNWIEATYVAGAATTTCTFQNAVIEVVKI